MSSVGSLVYTSDHAGVCLHAVKLGSGEPERLKLEVAFRGGEVALR